MSVSGKPGNTKQNKTLHHVDTMWGMMAETVSIANFSFYFKKESRKKDKNNTEFHRK